MSTERKMVERPKSVGKGHRTGASARRIRGSVAISNELLNQFRDLVLKGLPFDGCCDYLGIRTDQFYIWLRRGEQYLKGNCEPIEDALYGDFVDMLKRSLAEYRLKMSESLHKKDNRNWFRDLMVLERRDRKNFGRNEAAGGADDQFNPDEKFV